MKNTTRTVLSCTILPGLLYVGLNAGSFVTAKNYLKSGYTVEETESLMRNEGLVSAITREGRHLAYLIK